MTRDEIIRMAKDVGFQDGWLNLWAENFERFAALVASAEREAARAEREKQEPIFWYRPCCGGELYEGPVHNDSITGKWMREERPEEWVPLYAATPVTAQVRLNDSEMEMIARAHGTGGWQTLDDMVRFARAIETAVLRANGFDIQPPRGRLESAR